MAPGPQTHIVDEKNSAMHTESVSGPGATSEHDTKDKIEVTNETLPASMKPLGLIKALRTYKVASIICVLAAVGVLSDGYQIQMSGSIVALPGFIQTFGELQSDGEYAIDPQYLALWGCKCAILDDRKNAELTLCSIEECRRHGRRECRILSRRQVRSEVDDSCGADHHGCWLHSGTVCNALDTLAWCTSYGRKFFQSGPRSSKLNVLRECLSAWHNAASMSTSPRWRRLHAVGH